MELFAIHMTCYWAMVYVFDNIKDKPHCFIHSAKSSLRNQFCVTLPCVCIMNNFYPQSTSALHLSVAFTPFLTVVTDLYFYIFHRILHSKLMWNHHRYHHRGDVRIVKALDADLLEHLVVNLGSFVSGFVHVWMILTFTCTVNFFK